MADLYNTTELLDSEYPWDYLNAIDVLSQGFLYNGLFITISIIIIISYIWSEKSVSKGLMYGGFLLSLIGIIAWYAELLSIISVMTMFTLTVIGILLTILEQRD